MKPQRARVLANRLQAPGDILSRRSSKPSEPGSAMFARVRLQLTLWYTLALATILLVAGLVLYVAMQQVVLGPVDGTLVEAANHASGDWRNQTHFFAAPVSCQDVLQHTSRELPVPYTACYGPRGDLQAVSALGNVLNNSSFQIFADNGLAETALHNSSGTATDTIDAGQGLGAIRRTALVVRDSPSGNVLGVIQVGYPIEGQLSALHALGWLLVVCGVLTVFGAAAGGIFMAGKALQPARLAFARQQTFIADASHELRTPLTLLRADAEVLLRGRDRLPPEDAELLEDIVTESSHMATLASNMLSLARLDSGNTQIERDVVDMTEVAASVVHRAQTLAAERFVSLTTQPGSPALVIGDRALLEQAALVLVENAIKYNRPDGTVDVRVDSLGGKVQLEVRDTGIGISAEHLSRLGERFYRVEKSRSREQGGAGLGLSIARGIATAHGGTLTFASELGKGTAATLTLPGARAA